MRLRNIAVFAALGVTSLLVGCSSSDTSPAGGGGDGGIANETDGSTQSGSDSGTHTGLDSGSATDSGASDGGSTHDGGHCPGCGDGGGPGDAAPGDAGDGFGMACTVNADCPAAYPDCFTFNAKGQHCTKKCATAADCPGGAGGLGCSGMGVCKIP